VAARPVAAVSGTSRPVFQLRGSLQRHHPDERAGDQVRGQVAGLLLDNLGAPHAFGQHPDQGVSAGEVEVARLAAAGDLQEVGDELLGQRGGPGLDW
jgi:hypothetical protein